MFFPDTCMRGSLLIPALRAAHLLTGTPDGHSHPVFGIRRVPPAPERSKSFSERAPGASRIRRVPPRSERSKSLSERTPELPVFGVFPRAGALKSLKLTGSRLPELPEKGHCTLQILFCWSGN